MKLIVISNPINLNNEHSILFSLFENGLEYYHLRKPNFTFNKLKQYIDLIPEKFHNKIILHSHHQLAVDYNFKGVHYTHDYPYKNGATTFENLQQSVSCHSLDELGNLDENFQYAFISPVFDSISKANYKAQFNTNELKNFLSNYNKRVEVIALGGIDEQTIDNAAELGFDGLSVLGAIWNSSNPIEKFNALNHSCKKYTKQKIHA